MKNRWLLFFVLAVFVLSTAIPTSSAFAAGKTATLVDFKHQPAKGWTAIFKITGDWKESDLKGNSITVDGKTYNLYCNFRDEDHISCTMSHDMGQLIGKPATFNFAGVVSANVVPPKRICNTWHASWESGFGEGYEEWTATWYEWAYFDLIARGSITYGENMPIPDPYEYFYEAYGTEGGSPSAVSLEQNGDGDVLYWYEYEYGFGRYFDRYCSEAEYTYDEYMMELESLFVEFGEGYCDEEGCDEDTFSEECDEDGCWVCENGECFPNGDNPN